MLEIGLGLILVAVVVVVVVEGKFVRRVFIQKYLRRASCSTLTQTASSLGYVWTAPRVLALGMAVYTDIKKVKASHTGYRALVPELIPVYRQSSRRWLKSSTQR